MRVSKGWLEIADSDYGMWRSRLKLRTTPKQDHACLLLEAKGLRFLVDYGYQNAEEILRQRVRAAKEPLTGSQN